MMDNFNEILIIDDELEYCSLMKEYFSGEGYSVEASYNGIEGLEKVKSFNPDVILLDKKMPEMSGKECINLI